MNTKEKGGLAVAKAIQHYIFLGNEVLLPMGDKKPYDLVVDCGQLKKVQCKYTTYCPKDNYVVPLRVMGGNQSFSYGEAVSRR